MCVCVTSLLGQVRVFSTRPSSFTPLSSPTLSFHSPHTPLLSLFHCSSSTQAGQLPCVKFPPRPLSLPSCTGSYVTLWDSYFSFFFFFCCKTSWPCARKTQQHWLLEGHHVHRQTEEAAEESTGCSHSCPQLGAQPERQSREGRAPSALERPSLCCFMSGF